MLDGRNARSWNPLILENMRRFLMWSKLLQSANSTQICGISNLLQTVLKMMCLCIFEMDWMGWAQGVLRYATRHKRLCTFCSILLCAGVCEWMLILNALYCFPLSLSFLTVFFQILRDTTLVIESNSSSFSFSHTILLSVSSFLPTLSPSAQQRSSAWQDD